MRQVNTGNALPFYRSQNHRSVVYFNSVFIQAIGGSRHLAPFQLVILKTEYDDTRDFFFVLDENGLLLAQIYPVARYTATHVIFTFNEPVDNLVQNCKVCTIQLTNTNTGQGMYYSDWIYVKSDWDASLSWNNSGVDLNDLMYQTGYIQTLYFDYSEETPLVEINNETTVNLLGEEITTSSRQTEYRRLVFTCLDSQMTALQRVSQHAQIALVENDTSTATLIKNVSFEFEPFEGIQNVTMSFLSSTSQLVGCGTEQYVLLP